MKKIIVIFLLIFGLVGSISIVKAESKLPSWEFLPNGVNYIDPSNVWYKPTNGGNSGSIRTISKFRVLPDTEYRIYKIDHDIDFGEGWNLNPIGFSNAYPTMSGSSAESQLRQWMIDGLGVSDGMVSVNFFNQSSRLSCANTVGRGIQIGASGNYSRRFKVQILHFFFFPIAIIALWERPRLFVCFN